MLKSLLFFSLILFSIFGNAQLVVGNAGGLVESQLVYVWTSLENYLKPCLSSDACAVNAADKAILAQIAMESENVNRPLIFYKQSEKPDLTGKFFETEALVGSQVYINLDYLYLDGENILLEKRDFHEAILQLVAAKFFQHGFALDYSYKIGRSVADLARTRVSRLGLYALGFPAEGFSVFTSQRASFLFFSDTVEMYDLTPRIHVEIPCRAQVTQIHNLHWNLIVQQIAVGQGQLKGFCIESGIEWRSDFEVKLTYDITSKPQLRFEIRPELTVVNIFDFEKLNP